MILLTTMCLSACGGGGSGEDTPPTPSPQPIRVNAGTNIVSDENQSVNLLGGSSGGQGAITYSWSALPTLDITHADTSITDASFIAPITTQSTTITLTLSATDSNGAIQSDSIIVTVNPVNALPDALITANQIEGYGNRQYPVSSSIELDGSGSSDSDPQGSGAAISSYLWQQIAGPSLLAGIDTSQSAISLIAPALDETQQAIFRLTVTDQEQGSGSIDISLSLLAEQNTIPQAQIVPMRSVFAGELVKLSGSASSLSTKANPFSAQWLSNQAWVINDNTAFETYAHAPMVSSDTTSNLQLRISDSFRNTASAQVQTQVFAPVTRVFNDTGVTQFADAQNILSEYPLAFAGQDADYGADRQVLSGSVAKVGDGDSGFDFTRVDNNGDVVENPSFDFSCVRDNVSGLVWQVKSINDTVSLNYVEQQFAWFNEEDNGNVQGNINSDSLACNVSNAQCNTQDYIAQINSQGLCGLFDWRLPTPLELQSIVHYGKSTPPMVDTVFFPFWGSNNNEPLWYWTSQSSADGVSDDLANNAWAYDMNTGNDGFVNKNTLQRVILVRAGR